MSYPSFGCYAQCLKCELCEVGLTPAPDLDLDLDLDYGAGDQDLDGIPDWADPDWALPGAESPDPFEDLPTGIPVGEDWELRPTWDPWGLELKGTFP